MNVRMKWVQGRAENAIARFVSDVDDHDDMAFMTDIERILFWNDIAALAKLEAEVHVPSVLPDWTRHMAERIAEESFE